MDSRDYDPLRRIAGHVADGFAECGYAFVEDDKIEGLAAMLGSFLTVAGIPVNPPDADDPTPGGDGFFPVNQAAPAADRRLLTTRSALP